MARLWPEVTRSKKSSSSPSFKRGEPRWSKFANILPDGTVSSYSYRVAWYDGGKRQRQNFDTLDAAEQKVKEETKKLLEHEHGLVTQVTTLGKAQIESAQHAYRLLEIEEFFDRREPKTADSLYKAVEWFIKTYPKQMATLPTVKEVVEKFLKTRASASKRTLWSHESYLNEFSRTHGTDLVAAITPAHISAYLDNVKVGDVAKLHRWDSLHALFEFCRGKKNIEGTWIQLNPVKQVPEPVYHPSKPKLYSPNECRKLIEGALLHEYAPNIIVRLFSMIRSEEMAAMVRNQGSVWPYVDLKTGWIQLTAKEVKTRADKKRGGRRIRILPVLKRWLRAFEKRKWDITENTTLDAKVRKHVDATKLGRGSGYHNLVRHTAISYRVVLENSFSSVADEAGTSEAILRASYFERVTAGDVKKLFNFTPEKFSLPPVPRSPQDS